MPNKETLRKLPYEKSYRRFGLKLNIRTDADIIAQLDSQPSIQGYIRSLVRQDMARQQKERDQH